MKKAEKIALLGVLGIVSGFIIGIALAPCSGEEMQKKIGLGKRTAEEKLKLLESKIYKLEEKLKKDKKS